MRRTELLRYQRDLGWSDPPDLPDCTPAPNGAANGVAGSLEELARQVDGCTACDLCKTRKKIVFGEGHPRARVLFIGEGPGAEEDKTGRPFVGQAGRLLDGMISALGLERRQVYIANVVKCRPPRNRDPVPEEMAACAAYLDQQIELIRPQVIVALGRVSSRRLTGADKTMGALRGRWSHYRGVPLLPTFHPAYLLRQPAEKRRVWADLKKVLEHLKAAGSNQPASD